MTPRHVRRSIIVGLLATALAVPASAASPPVEVPPGSASVGPELYETTRLADRRSLVSGDRAYAMGDETGRYPATGWHIRGEMGGFWTQPMKMLDGLWFAVGGDWLGDGIAARKYTSGQGYQRIDYGTTNGVGLTRTDFVPDGMRSVLVGLTFTASDSARTIDLDTDAHSELLPSYPWGWTTPSAATANLPDSGSYADGALVFRDQGTPPGMAAHDYAAVAGSNLKPVAHALGSGHRGPQEPAVVCPADGTAPPRCDDSAFGKGTGGRLTYRVPVAPGRPTTVWFAVSGSDEGLAAAHREHRSALRDAGTLLKAKIASRAKVAAQTVVDLPGDPLLQQSVAWSKQNLADSVQEARDLELRDVNEGKDYPAPTGSLPKARWYGAGFPDYPWLFATDGEYTAYAAVAAGQFDTVRDHLRALRDISDQVNKGSGKVVHEVMPTGDVYFGSNQSAGNTDETVKFPSIVALLWRWTGDDRFRDEMYDFSVRNLRYVYRELDDDKDGWPEGLANVERSGMGVEKLDSTVYLARGLRDLADLAASRRDGAVEAWATAKAEDLERRFESQWWVDAAKGYADSVDDPADPANDNKPIFQRHWTGVTPMEVELTRPAGVGPLASRAHGLTALAQRETPCYTGEFGLFHTGSGPTSDPAGNPGPSCDSVVSAVKSERSIFSLNTSIMAVAEGNFGRLGPLQQQRYTTGNARIQLDPKVWETPGAMPEIAPSPDFIANIDRPFYDRSMNLQAWGTYGVLWPVVHQYLGVSPALGRHQLSVVPQLPAGQNKVAASNIRLGRGSIDVSARQVGKTLSTDVRLNDVPAALTIGAVLPAGAEIASVRMNDRTVPHRLVETARGTELRVITETSHASLRITLR
ncbi:glycogen debranching protein [Kribbella sp. NBC_01245]|uniref:glycogen debranching protein n=1 Tax=Kribbella sp. NBC_01245 TaxID=2903578 RepID=UPI002E2C1E1A|nr:glycogen debranching protein [Kribbella sp. NBC_01245]